MDVPLSTPILLDGATGTELLKRGMPHGVSSEEWVFSHPKVLLELQREYVSQGAQVLTAPTLGANPAALERFGLAARCGELNRRLAALSREAAAGKTLVAGDIGPCGMKSVPHGEAKFEDVVENYKVQVSALKEAGVDLYLMETMLSLTEARAALLAVKETDPGKQVLVSFFCDEEGRTPTGTDVLAALIVMEGMGAAAFGVNCMPPEQVYRQLERLIPYASIPLLAMPSGEKEGTEAAEWVAKYGELGVRCFGGCCGTTPADTGRLRDALGELELSPFTPCPQDPDVIPCAGKEARFITPDVDVGEMLECTPELLEEIVEAEEERPQGALKIAILEEDDVDVFAENQYAIRDALCLWSDVPELLEKALRVFQGRAFWDGTTELEETFLARMAEKYGLVLL